MKKISVNIKGHLTSFSLEEEFYDALKKQAKKEKLSMAALIAKIDLNRGKNNLSSAVRVYILKNID